MAYVLLGGSGVLGSGFRSVLRRQSADVLRLTPAWGHRHALQEALATSLAPAVNRNTCITIVWAAGSGSVGSDPISMAAESADVRVLCRAVEALPEQAHARVSLLFASSAGALYGGYGSQVVNEDSEPQPITPYGHEKLRQEEELARTAARTGCTVLSCRYSNIFGLASERLTVRGLVSTAVRATRLRQPMVIYVSPDTRRDLVYHTDAARMSLELIRAARPGFSARLVRDGTSRTVAEVIGVVRHVSGRRVPATYAERPETRFQPRVLRFTPPPQQPGSVRPLSIEAAVHLMMRAPMAP